MSFAVKISLGLTTYVHPATPFSPAHAAAAADVQDWPVVLTDNRVLCVCACDFAQGMVDCQDESPLPDFYSGILFSQLMGQKVLKVSTDSDTLRAYAHCSASGAAGDVTVLLLNLSPTTTRKVTLAGMDAVVQHKEWHLTGPNGTASIEMALNGNPLHAHRGASSWTLPSLDGRAVPTGAGDVVELAPSSIAFVAVSVSDASVCK